MTPAPPVPPAHADDHAPSVAAPGTGRLRGADALAIAAITAVNLGLRGLELGQRKVEPYFTLSDGIIGAPWRLLFPLDIGDGYSRWSTTGLAVVGVLQTVMSTTAVFLLFNVALVLGAFLLAWHATRSRPFAYALAGCMAVTTQYHWSYMNSGVLPLYLMSLYLLWQLAAFAWLVWDGLPGTPQRPRVVFVVSLLALALSWEQWLDYWLFAMCFGAVLYAASGRQPRIRRHQLRFAMTATAIVGVVYIVVKLATAAEHGTPGKESELVLGYVLRDGLGVRVGSTLLVEDMVSNFFSYTYLTLTNFVPPALLPGQALNALSTDALVATQRGYHPQMAHLVGYHHVFLWYLAAGALTTALVLATAWATRRAILEARPIGIAMAALGLLILTGSATHILIKFRPYLSEPFLHYKAGVGITATAVLIALTVALAWQRRGRRGRAILSVGLGVVLLWGAFTRPTALSAMSTRLQMGVMPTPDLITPTVQAVHRHYTPTKQRVLRLFGR